MEIWTDGMLWALAEKVHARAEVLRVRAAPAPVQAELPLGPGGNVVTLKLRPRKPLSTADSLASSITSKPPSS